MMEWFQDRWYEFRLGDSTYLRYVIYFSQFIIIVYTLFIERFVWLVTVFPSFMFFALSILLVYPPLAIIIGRFIHRKKQLRRELSILAEENPIFLYSTRIAMDQMIKICENLGVEVSSEYLMFYRYVRNLEEKVKWKPT